MTMKIKASTIVSGISFAFYVSYITSFILFSIGWLVNVRHVLSFVDSTQAINLKDVMEIIGIFVPPLGAVLGLLF